MKRKINNEFRIKSHYTRRFGTEYNLQRKVFTLFGWDFYMNTGDWVLQGMHSPESFEHLAQILLERYKPDREYKKKATKDILDDNTSKN